MMACIGGNVDAALSRLDSLLASGPVPDGYAVRAACYSQRFVRDSVRADGEAAVADLGRALDDASGQFSESDLYSRRAFARLALDPTDYPGMLADLDRAVELAPERPGHRLDRSTARALAGDASGARADLDALAARPDLDSATAATVRQRLDSLPRPGGAPE